MGNFTSGFESGSEWSLISGDIDRQTENDVISGAYEGDYFLSYEDNNNDTAYVARYDSSDVAEVDGYFYWFPSNTSGFIDIGVGVRGDSNDSFLALTFDGDVLAIQEGTIGNLTQLDSTSVSAPSVKQWLRVDFHIEEDSNGDVTGTFEVGNNSWTVGPVTPSKTSSGYFYVGGFQDINTGAHGGIDYVNVTDIGIEVPSSPQNVSATVDANDQITLNWDAPSDWGGDRGHYDIDISRDGASYVNPSGGPTEVNDDGSSSYSKSYGPNSDTAYDRQVGIDSSFQFRVRAENSAGTSGWTYSNTVYTDPIPPHNPSVSRPDANTIEISWENRSTLISNNNASCGTDVFYRKDGGTGYGNWSKWTNISGNATSWSTNNLDPDSRYQFYLRHYHQAVGNPDTNYYHAGPVYADYGNEGNVYFEDDFESGDLSVWDTTSGSVSAKQDDNSNWMGLSGGQQGSYSLRIDNDGYITKQLGDLSEETNVIVKCIAASGNMDDSTESGKIQWYDGSSWQNVYEMHWEYNRQGWHEVSVVIPDPYLSNDNRLRLRGFTSANGRAETGFDRVVVSDILDEYTHPAAPTLDSLDSSTKREIEVDWTVNASVMDVNPTNPSEVNYGEGSNTNDNKLMERSPPYTITGLKDGEKYSVHIHNKYWQYRRGSQEQFWLTRSDTKSATTILPAPDLSASIVDNNRISASWTDNSNNENGFKLLLSADGGSSFSQQGGDISPNTTSYTTSELPYDQDYQAKVRAFTEHASSDSNIVSLKTGYGLQYYNSSFTPGTVKIYDGNNWVRPFKVKRFDGSQWD